MPYLKEKKNRRIFGPAVFHTSLELDPVISGLAEKIVFVAELPKGPTGKIQRIGLAEKLGLGESDKPRIPPIAEFCAPRNDTEARLAEMWREVLKLERTGVRDNFFDAGGDSVLAVQLIARIRQSFGVELSTPRLFQSPTIVELAEAIDEMRNSSPSDEELLRILDEIDALPGVKAEGD